MYDRALQVASSPDEQADALRSLGILYLRRGELERAFEHGTP
jgi:lipopolysaccharide biosynthesis regulator YciM